MDRQKYMTSHSLHASTTHLTIYVAKPNVCSIIILYIWHNSILAQKVRKQRKRVWRIPYFGTHFQLHTQSSLLLCIKTHDSESRGQEEAGLRDERVCYLQVVLLWNL